MAEQGRDRHGRSVAALRLRDLRDELRRRGCDLIPIGALPLIVSDFELEIERLRAQLAEAQRKLDSCMKVGFETLDRAAAAEMEVERLAAAAMAETINDLERGSE